MFEIKYYEQVKIHQYFFDKLSEREYNTLSQQKYLWWRVLMKKLLCLILTFALLLSLFSCSVYARGPEDSAGPDGSGQTPVSDVSATVRESGEPAGPEAFREDLFSDVSTRDWFFSNVKNAYELGLMEGYGGGVFAPLGSVTLAEVITIAVRLRSAHLGDDRDLSGGTPWYAPAVEYAAAQGIIRSGDFADYTRQATRAQVAYILSGALPSGALREVNTVEDNSLPDVKMGDAYAAGIYFLYRTGILSGADANGTFYPSSTVTRAETAAIASRIASEPLRVTCAFYAPAYPDLSLRARAGDSFFANTAILGNSLIDGLRGYSNLQTPDYFCATSMSVVSALNNRDVPLRNGAYGTQIDAMAQKQYDKVYIELGINEIGSSTDYFISLYRTLLDRIRAVQPNADIYIMAVTPTSRSKNGTSYNRERVIMYNEALYALAAQWGCYYLDDFTPLADSEGYLADSDTWDGVHFNIAKYAAWEELIRTYYA